MVTASEFEAVWSVIGKLGVAIAVIVGIIQGLKYLMSQMPVSKLELRVDENKKSIEENRERMKKIDNRIGKIEEKIEATEKSIDLIDEGIIRIGESQISLLRHFVNGNGQQEMEQEAERLTEFFIRREKKV